MALGRLTFVFETKNLAEIDEVFRITSNMLTDPDLPEGLLCGSEIHQDNPRFQHLLRGSRIMHMHRHRQDPDEYVLANRFKACVTVVTENLPALREEMSNRVPFAHSVDFNPHIRPFTS